MFTTNFVNIAIYLDINGILSIDDGVKSVAIKLRRSTFYDRVVDTWGAVLKVDWPFGWCFGTFGLFFPSYWGMSSSQLTNIFQRG